MSSLLFRAWAVAIATLATTHAQSQPASTGSGQAYPAKPVRIVVGFVPGGGSDFIARLVSQKITEPLGRSVLTPAIPTIAESGVPGFDTSGWFGVVAPTGTPRAITERLQAEIVKGITAADARERLSAMGGDVVASSSADFAAFMRADHAKWAKVVAAAGLRDNP